MTKLSNTLRYFPDPELGSGAFGEVFLGEHISTEKFSRGMKTDAFDFWAFNDSCADINTKFALVPDEMYADIMIENQDCKIRQHACVLEYSEAPNDEWDCHVSDFTLPHKSYLKERWQCLKCGFDVCKTCM
jgi:hypothetical protein